MKTIKGPGIYLAQFAADQAPYNTLADLSQWVAERGFEGVQIPTWDNRLIDMKQAAESKTYCDDLKGVLAANGLDVTELGSHITGQLVAVHPAHDRITDSFAPAEVRGHPAARRAWAEEQMRFAARASRNLGIDRHVSFTGSLLWPYLYPYPQWPEGLVDEAFDELARRWTPILNDPSHFMLQALDYLEFIDHYHERIKMFHVKDAEFRPNSKTGAYGGFQPWSKRAGRFRSLGDGQIDFGAVFTKLATYDFDGWAVLEWECFIKHPEDGAAEGAKFIREHMIRVADRAFDDFVKSGADRDANRAMLGLDRGAS